MSTLPPEITQFNNPFGLHLHGNPLTSPPLELAIQGVGAIQNYFASLKSESRLLSELKVLLVGDGSAGKTSLVKRLLGEDFDRQEPTTHGIRIRHWPVEQGAQAVRVKLWDFGGQQIMHATHQFFLSKRSLYILVLDGRRDERAEYWLKHIESFGGDSPILVVLNKYDENPGYNINRPFLQQKYPGIRGFYRTSCETGQGIDEFRAALLREIVGVELLETRWANSWFAIKEQLENLQQHYISYEEYEQRCVDAGITEPLSQDVLVDFLHDLGVIVHFRDFELEDTQVIEPRWVTTAVYKIITAERVAAHNGVLHLRDLRAILQPRTPEDYVYPQSKHRYLISLMKKFELCYSLDDERVLIPRFLGVEEPAFDFDYDGSLKFVLDYEDFLPDSILARFMVKRHPDIKDNLQWRTGVVLENAAFGSTAVVRADVEAQRISIFVHGEQRKDYLAAILLFFRELNASFEKLRVSELIPMPDNPNVTVPYPTLLQHVRLGMTEIIPNGADKAYAVRDLLGLIQLDGRDDLQEILSILRRIDSGEMDKKSFVERANRIVDLKPNFMGLGINLNDLFEQLYERHESR